MTQEKINEIIAHYPEKDGLYFTSYLSDMRCWCYTDKSNDAVVIKSQSHLATLIELAN